MLEYHSITESVIIMRSLDFITWHLVGKSEIVTGSSDRGRCNCQAIRSHLFSSTFQHL